MQYTKQPCQEYYCMSSDQDNMIENRDKIIAQLREEIEELRTVIALLPGNVYWKNIDGYYLGCNYNMAEIYGLSSPDETIGRSDVDLMGPELGEQARNKDLAILAGRQEKTMEELGFNADRKKAIYLSVKTPLFNRKGKIHGILGVSFDISDRKRTEQKLKISKQRAEAANRSKSQFLATISHELRTPLTSILGFASLIEQPQLAQNKKHEYTQHIINSGSYLLTLINSLLDFNKLETHKFEVTLLPLNLKEIIESAINMLKGAAKLKNLPLLLEYGDDVPLHVMSNSRILRQILINLIGNAIKFTETGNVTVKVSTVKIIDNVASLEISVQDSGIGISAKEQSLIFKRFYQSGDIYTRNKSQMGTGLGLAIVKKLVQLLDGKIKIKSSIGKGSTFIFNGDFITISSKDVPWLPYAASVKILVVVEDSNLAHVHTLLANSIYEIATPGEALSQLLSAQQGMQPYHIIMLDYDIQQTEAKALIENIQAQAELHQPLVIMLNEKPALQKDNLFASIPIDPNALNPQNFQEHLKTAWEAWLQQTKKPVTPITTSGQLYVLLIEDNPLIQIIHKYMLEELGCKVDVIDSANGALELIENNYHLLFVDIGLPDISGFELIKKIRQLDQSISQVPIVVLTGYSEDEECNQCLQAGANEVAVKPISKETLEKILQQYVKDPS
jgi:PAS domain S-box-containing protein